MERAKSLDQMSYEELYTIWNYFCGKRNGRCKGCKCSRGKKPEACKKAIRDITHDDLVAVVKVIEGVKA